MTLIPPKSPAQLLDMYFNDLRSHFLEAAATLDRLERAGISNDPAAMEKLANLLKAASVLSDNKPERAKRFLEELSDK